MGEVTVVVLPADRTCQISKPLTCWWATVSTTRRQRLSASGYSSHQRFAMSAGKYYTGDWGMGFDKNRHSSNLSTQIILQRCRHFVSIQFILIAKHLDKIFQPRTHVCRFPNPPYLSQRHPFDFATPVAETPRVYPHPFLNHQARIMFHPPS